MRLFSTIYLPLRLRDMRHLFSLAARWRGGTNIHVLLVFWWLLLPSWDKATATRVRRWWTHGWFHTISTSEDQMLPTEGLFTTLADSLDLRNIDEYFKGRMQH